MANGNDTYNTDKPLTPDQIAAAAATEEAKRNAIAGTVGQMQALTTQVVPPRNRMYMGPNTSGAGGTSPQDFFGLVTPYNVRINNLAPPEPLTPEAQSALQGRLAAATGQKQYDPRLTAIDPTLRQFAAQDQIRRAMDQGITAADAMRIYGQGLFAPVVPPRRYNVSGVGLVDESGQVITPGQRSAAHNVPGVGLVDAQTGRIITPARTVDPANTAQIRALANAKAALQADIARGFARSPNDPDPKKAEEGKRNAQQIQEWDNEIRRLQGGTATTPTPRPAATTTATTPTPITRPAAAQTAGTAARIRVKNPQGKIGTIPANQLQEALAAGWTRM